MEERLADAQTSIESKVAGALLIHDLYPHPLASKERLSGRERYLAASTAVGSGFRAGGTSFGKAHPEVCVLPGFATSIAVR